MLGFLHCFTFIYKAELLFFKSCVHEILFFPLNIPLLWDNLLWEVKDALILQIFSFFLWKINVYWLTHLAENSTKIF